MSCFHPIECWRLDNQTKLSFVKPRNERHVLEKMQVPCGHCIGCLLDKSNDWATRCWCEASNWKNNCFITLTYNDKNLPKNKELRKDDLQKFWKRLRYYEQGNEYWKNPRTGKHERPIRYFSCGEYGPKNGRPHFHACVFNWKPNDLKFYKLNHQNQKLYTSKTLSKIWGKGFVIIGELTYQSACYVARYVTKKIYGQLAKLYYQDKQPEFTESSRNGGIGIIKWIEEKEKIIKNEGLFIKIGEKVKLKPIPKFFIKKWKEEPDADLCEYYIYEKCQRAKINKAKILIQTNLNESEYLRLQEKNLTEKSKILKRTNLI